MKCGHSCKACHNQGYLIEWRCSQSGNIPDLGINKIQRLGNSLKNLESKYLRYPKPINGQWQLGGRAYHPPNRRQIRGKNGKCNHFCIEK